jgi:hypothetical protein
MPALIQPLFDGPIDLVGDVHGEIDALRSLLGHLGYDAVGKHPERRLVFLGDLTDRGPDSPAVVRFVQEEVLAGRAQCVLGNHDFNLLLGHQKYDNNWFGGKEFSEDGYLVPQVLADRATRKQIRTFLGTLPLALERPDVRVVHACWHAPSIDLARTEQNAVDLYNRYLSRIKADHVARHVEDEVELSLDHQNRNPVKLLTSGPERRIENPITVAGKPRYQDRVRWWDDYREPPLCVFGHYALRHGQPRGNGQAFCLDYGVAYRWKERLTAVARFETRLAAFRIPEHVIVFDDGSTDRLPEFVRGTS